MAHDHAGRSGGQAHVPKLIAWEVTRSCMLACTHCRAAARAAPYEGELSTDECFRLLDNIAAFSKPIIILTGGEPMLRPDIYDIAAYGTKLGLRMVMAPCGALIDDESAAKILASGIGQISISLDGAAAASHDAFRGVDGAFDSALRGIEAAKRQGLGFQINTTITQVNLDELPDILDLAKRLGANVFNPFLLVPTGRGRELIDQEISPAQYEQTLRWLAEVQQQNDIPIRVTCAPHYQRIVRQMGVHKSGGHAAKGCMGGQQFAFISHLGKVQICGFLEAEAGDLREADLDFQKIWETSELFLQMRDLDGYHGRCGGCEFVRVCGGCRARAFALTGDYLGEEPFCTHQPKRRDALERDELDDRLLSLIQTDFPVTVRPFDTLAETFDTDARRIIQRINRLQRAGVIRRLGAVFDSKSLGYVSTLVAASVPPEGLDEVAATVSELSGVTHNYRREHAYNLWFTLTAESAQRLQDILADLASRTGAGFFPMPALAVYKIRVDFRLGEGGPAAEAASPVRQSGEVASLDDRQKQLVRRLQESISLTDQPFDIPADEIGWPTQRVIEQIGDWRQAGVIRRFGAVVDHHRLGFAANGMAVFRVPDDEIDDVGRRLAERAEISHCYHRPPLEGFDYNLFAMVHAQTPEQVRAIVADIAGRIGPYEHTVLFATTEYKKVSMKYFV